MVAEAESVAARGSALDHELVGRMLGRRRGGGPREQLSPRERDVLAAMAEGKSNQRTMIARVWPLHPEGP